jgi:hypothetical protein
MCRVRPVQREPSIGERAPPDQCPRSLHCHRAGGSRRQGRACRGRARYLDHVSHEFVRAGDACCSEAGQAIHQAADRARSHLRRPSRDRDGEYPTFG